MFVGLWSGKLARDDFTSLPNRSAGLMVETGGRQVISVKAGGIGIEHSRMKAPLLYLIRAAEQPDAIQFASNAAHIASEPRQMAAIGYDRK